MEGILHKLILPDNDVINEGTKELQAELKKSDAVPALCSVIGSSPNPQIRQLAGIILKKKLTKHRYWLKLPLETRQFVKQGLMQSLVNDQEKSVKTAIGQVIGVLIRHEIPENGWPELMQFIQQMTMSDNINDKELGFFTLQILTDMASDQFLTHAHSFATLFTNTLNGLQDPASNLAYLTLMCMVNFVAAIEGDQFMVNAYHSMMPRVMAVVKGLATKRPDKAVEALYLVDELADSAITVIVSHLRLIVETCLELSLDRTCGEDLQIKALNIVGTLIQTKKKQIVKLKMVEPILDVLFRLMCTPGVDDGEDDFPGMDESQTATTVANQILDMLALHLPPDKLLLPLMEKYMIPNIQHNDPNVRKAVYLGLAVVVEGCADYIRQRHMQDFISYVKTGLSDPTPLVTNAALFAVGQFSEHLQPNISIYASEIIPILLEHLKDILKKEEEPSQKVDRMFYALESFCENLNESLLPFLPLLMSYLIPLLSPPHPVRLRELAISAVGACANAAKEEMMPYFPGIMNSFKEYLTEIQSSETMCLQVQSVDTLGILARTIGNENFMPMTRETMELGIQLINKTDDPDLRKSLYGLFASVSTVLKQEMAPYLTIIVDLILKSIRIDKGVILHKDDNNPTVGLFENLSDTEESEEDLGNTSDVSSDKENSEDGFTVENAYLEEKEEAVIAVRELAQNCLEAFEPYVEVCFQEIFRVVNYPHDDIRSAALGTVTQLCIHMHKVSPGGRHALQSALNMLIPKCAEVVRTDKEREVVITGLDTYLELLKEIGSPVLEGEGHTDAIINCVKDVLNCRTECQDEGDGEEGEEEAEGDELLIESAGEIIPHLGKVMPPLEFAQHYTQFLPMFVNLTKKQASDAQRSFGVGMIAECMGCAGPCLPAYAQQLLSLLVTLARDQNDEVRNNAIFALGELVYHGRECVFPFYGEILQTLSNAVVNESNSGALDNICGALARLIITNVSGIPLEQVIPVFVRYLPLREDFEENKWVYQSLNNLYQMGSAPLLQNLNPVIKACAISLHGNQIETENRSLILNLLKSCHRDFPTECTQAARELPEPVASTLKEACVS